MCATLAMHGITNKGSAPQVRLSVVRVLQPLHQADIRSCQIYIVHESGHNKYGCSLSPIQNIAYA